MADKSNHLFDQKLLKRALATSKSNPPRFYIGMNALDKKALSYCLMRKFNGIMEVVLAKTMRDETLFNQEVDNLAKYFEAEKINETA